jgi:TPR repeat protein
VSSAEQAPSLPAGYTQRPATLEDIAAVGALFRRSEDRLGLRPESAESFLRWVLPLPYVALARGLGVDRDAPQALKWFTLAADQRDPEAQLNLALFYIKGDGVPKDVATAEQWLHRSADNGNTRARRILTEGKYKQQ